MKVGDYVRTKDGNIYKIAELGYNNETFLSDTNEGWFLIYKSSPNIIDLLEKSDLVEDYTGDIYKVDYIYDDYVFTTFIGEDGITKTLTDYQIKSIVTKEQFESMKYEVEVC